MQKIYQAYFNNNHSDPHCFDNPQSIAVPETIGTCDLQVHSLPYNTALAYKQANLHQDTELKLQTNRGMNIYVYDKNYFGGARYRFSKHEQECLFRKDMMNVHLENDLSEYFFHAGKFNTLVLYLTTEMLEHVLRMTQINVDKRIKSFLSGQQFIPNLLQIPLSLAAQQTIAQIRQCPYEESGLQQMYIEAKVQEWLMHLLAALDKNKHISTETSLSYADKAKVLEAKERLLADLRYPPSLQMLAHAVGTNEKKLTAGFKALFGMPVFAWLREQRLQQAMQLLQEQQLSIKSIAHYCGYKHQSDFSNAFKARFKVSPSQVRYSTL